MSMCGILHHLLFVLQTLSRSSRYLIIILVYYYCKARDILTISVHMYNPFV